MSLPYQPIPPPDPWKAHRRHQLLFFLSFIAVAPVTISLIILLQLTGLAPVSSARYPLAIFICFFSVAAVPITYWIRTIYFRCPRCHKHYYRSPNHYDFTGGLPRLLKSCRHCHLPKNTPPPYDTPPNPNP
jgi:hypothetical protein